MRRTLIVKKKIDDALFRTSRIQLLVWLKKQGSWFCHPNNHFEPIFNLKHLRNILGIVLKPGPVGRPGSVAGFKQKNRLGIGPVRPGRPDWSARDPAGSGKHGWDPALFFIYIFMTETTSFWPFIVKRPKQEEQKNERSAEDLINFKSNSRNLQTHFSREEEQRSRRLLNPWSMFQIWE
jgi:hypothetical protein